MITGNCGTCELSLICASDIWRTWTCPRCGWRQVFLADFHHWAVKHIFFLSPRNCSGSVLGEDCKELHLECYICHPGGPGGAWTHFYWFKRQEAALVEMFNRSYTREP